MNIENINELEELANNGNVQAIYELGKKFYNGNGVGIDYSKAKSYFEKASSANNTYATYYLGKMYFWGDGVEKDYNKANECKESVLNNIVYPNKKVGIEEFYSSSDIEKLSENYAKIVLKNVATAFNNVQWQEISNENNSESISDEDAMKLLQGLSIAYKQSKLQKN